MIPLQFCYRHMSLSTIFPQAKIDTSAQTANALQPCVQCNVHMLTRTLLSSPLLSGPILGLFCMLIYIAEKPSAYIGILGMGLWMSLVSIPPDLFGFGESDECPEIGEAGDAQM